MEMQTMAQNELEDKRLARMRIEKPVMRMRMVVSVLLFIIVVTSSFLSIFLNVKVYILPSENYLPFALPLFLLLSLFFERSGVSLKRDCQELTPAQYEIRLLKLWTGGGLTVASALFLALSILAYK